MVRGTVLHPGFRSCSFKFRLFSAHSIIEFSSLSFVACTVAHPPQCSTVVPTLVPTLIKAAIVSSILISSNHQSRKPIKEAITSSELHSNQVTCSIVILHLICSHVLLGHWTDILNPGRSSRPNQGGDHFHYTGSYCCLDYGWHRDSLCSILPMHMYQVPPLSYNA